MATMEVLTNQPTDKSTNKPTIQPTAASSGLEDPDMAAMEVLANHMGLFLQKTNIIRDYLVRVCLPPLLLSTISIYLCVCVCVCVC